MFTAALALSSAFAAPASVTLSTPVHPERAAQIKEINAKQSTWTAAAHPRFAASPLGASKPLCGVNGDWVAEVERAVASGEAERFISTSDAPVPEAFDSETNWPSCAKTIGDIRDQSNCGCCWAFAGAEAASDRMCIATGGKMLMPLAAQDVCFCASFDGCGGGQITTPWTFIKSKGSVTGGQYESSGPFGAGYCSDFTLPHCHHHGPVGNDPYPSEGAPGCASQSSPKCPRTCGANATGDHGTFAQDKYTFEGRMMTASGETAIKQMIMEGGPVETAFTVYSDFENYAGGVYAHTTGQAVGGHAVKFVGWGTDSGVKYWKVANSWNPYWGEKGYFRIKVGSPGGIDDSVTGSSTDATWKKKL